MDCFLFFRMGDFYELFLEDAKRGAHLLEITLTARSKGKDGRVPMAGVPYHAIDSYLNKLVKAGYKAAICEQMTPPGKGIVERQVVRVVTPGTLMDEKALDRNKHNIIVAVHTTKDSFAVAAADISTGMFQVAEETLSGRSDQILNYLVKLQPSECIISDENYNNAEFLKMLHQQAEMNIFPYQNWNSHVRRAEKELKAHFKVKSLGTFGLEKKDTAIQAAAVLLGYLEATQKTSVSHIRSISQYDALDRMQLDRSTIVNLELFSTIRDQEKRGSLFQVLDNTITAMGGRMLRTWLLHPLLQKSEIEKRHEFVQELKEKRGVRERLREKLKNILDIERIIGRLSVGLGNAKDLVSLKDSLREIGEIGEEIALLSPTLAGECSDKLSPELQDIVGYIERHILPDPMYDIRGGGLIQNGVNSELDKLRSIVNKGKEWVVELEQQERKRTGIGSLKVRFNKVFGFYIEVSKANLNQVPADYMRKQTLVNGERFITPELKEQEEVILTAEERMNTLEYELFRDVVNSLLSRIEPMQKAADAIGIVDCICSFAASAESLHYTRPLLTTSGEIRIQAGRHPVVEQILDESQFVPNDVVINRDSHQLLVVTGPNMAGKSVFIRQVAVITLMAQIGSFVPADNAEISIVDRIFVRSGASDVISGGLSTFMVEMVETAQILHQATNDSLVIMDEIGRGTSTYDGISIAMAVAEELVGAGKTDTQSARPKTLFATHYHELQALEDKYPDRIKNIHMAIEEEQGKPVFLHTVMEGGASHSFGIAVAELAGVPDTVVQRAQGILAGLEQRDEQSGSRAKQLKGPSAKNTLDVVNSQSPLPFPVQEKNLKHIKEKLKQLDLYNTTPLQAMEILAELKKIAES